MSTTTKTREAATAPAAGTTIPLVDLGWQQAQVADEVAEGWTAVLARSAFVLGEEVERFEAAFARFCGVRHCVTVGNGTDALELMMRGAGIGPGDEVIVPTNSFVASALAVLRTGATPVLVDVDPATHLVDPERVAARIGPRTRAVMPVHLYGQVAPMEDLAAAAAAAAGPRPMLLEDAAQAQGARRHGVAAGGFGVAAATSFYPGKNIGAYGDGGAVLTNSDGLADRVRALRNYGSLTKYEHPEVGFNSRLDTIQAVVLSAKLLRLAAWNETRREVAARYDDLLRDLDEVVLPVVLPGNEHIWHLYVVRVPRRDEVLGRLHEAGIQAGIHYPIPIHLQGAFRDLGHGPGDFPVAEAAAGEILSLPMYPGITADQQERVAAELRRALR